MKLFYRLCRLVCTVLLCLSSAHARDLVVGQAYWQDPSGQAGWAHAAQQNYTPYSGVLNLGYTHSVTWLRLRLSHQSATPSDRFMVLRVLPNYLDEAELFDPLDPRPSPRRVGDQTSISTQEFKSTAYGFVLPMGTQDRDVWLRVKSANLRLIQVEAFGEMAMQSEEKNHLLSVVACVGLLFCLWLFNLFNWFWNRERLYTLFVFRTLYFLLILCLYFGLARYWAGDLLDPLWLDAAFSLGALGVTWVSCYFEYELLCEYRLKPWAKWLQKAVFAALALIVVAFLWGFKVEALAANAVLVLLMIVLFLTIAIWGTPGRGEASPQGFAGIDKKFFIGYYALIFVTHPFVNQWLLGWFDAAPQVLSMFAFYALLSTLVMTLIVQFRANTLRKNHQQLLVNLALADERVASERRRREEKSQLLGMLMHEVRNPLTVIELTQSVDSPLNPEMVRKNVNIIRNVLDRTLRLEKISDGLLVPLPTRLLFSQALARVLDDLGADATRLACEGDIHTELCTDAGNLHTVLINLLDNALKYSPPGDVVQLQLHTSSLPEQLRITVSNRLAEGERPDALRVFDKYYRGEGAKRQSGTGLGLYMVQQWVQRMGGRCVCTMTADRIGLDVCWPLSKL